MNFQAAPAEYYEKANDEILVVLQTESPRGVENAEAIYALPGVDAIFVGPNDLRAQMRHPGQPPVTDAELDQMLQRIVDIGKRVGCPTGMHVFDSESARRRAAQGMQFLAVGSELSMMTREAQSVLKALRPAGEAREVAKY